MERSYFGYTQKHLNGPENEAFRPFLAIAGLQKMETLLIYHVFRAYFKDSKSPKSEERVKQLTQYNADLEQRKILYKSKEWQRLRYKFLRENPRCVDCGQPTLWTM